MRMLLLVIALFLAIVGQPSSAAPLAQANLDPAAFAVSVGGRETTANLPIDGPSAVIWTDKTYPSTVQFGDENVPGTRSLRIGFKSPVTVGAVLVCGGGTLSVLKPTAVYPGRLDNDEDWIAASRIVNGVESAGEVRDQEYAVWVLPAKIATRALRFTHTPKPTDTNYGGSIGGAYLLDDRQVNIAPLAVAFADADNERAHRIINGLYDSWQAWDNGDNGSLYIVSAAHPAIVGVAWRNRVTLSGLCALWAGFGAATVQAFTGPDGENVRDAPDSQWSTVSTYSGIQSYYPVTLGPNWMPFPSPVTTRAVRLLITESTPERHPHLTGKTFGGKRVWLGELLAMAPLGAGSVASVIPAAPVASVAQSHPPIAVRFTLEEPGYVTLVIDDSTGHRIRNLVSETKFPAGDNVVWWDGLDDLGRDVDAARHAIYQIPGQMAAPGIYHVRGLTRQQIDLRYQFAAYDNANPAWQTKDASSLWLANHTAPNAIAFVPAGQIPSRDGSAAPSPAQVLIGSQVTEGGSGLAWVDLSGHKLFGIGWLGGTWTGAHCVAHDFGPSAPPGVYAYAACEWKGGSKYGQQAELRIEELINHSAPGAPVGNKEDPPLLDPVYPFPDGAHAEVGGIAAYNGLLVVSMPKMNSLLLVDAVARKVIGTASVDTPMGVGFDSHGRLLVLSGTKMLRYAAPGHPTAAGGAVSLGEPQTLVAAGLDAPQNIAFDSAGNIYVSDQGSSHQVKVFSPDGSALRVIGHRGAPAEGPYDPLQMRDPSGIAIDSEDHLWVAENSFQPKRISVWSLDGKLLASYYGPPKYGGGGELDPTDKSVFYYDGMAFKVDWAAGETTPVDVLWMAKGDHPRDLSFRAGFPETPIYAHGAKYFTDCFDSSATSGGPVAFIWKVSDGVARLVGAAGEANEWETLKGDEFKASWPPGIDLNGDASKNATFFLWTDVNGDGKPEPNEVHFVRQPDSLPKSDAGLGDIVVNQDLSICESRLAGNAVRFDPVGFTAAGAPEYDASKGVVIAFDVQRPANDGGNQSMSAPGGWAIMTAVPKPYSQYSVAGALNGKATWSYPSLWPGLHASHNAAEAQEPGEILGTTRLLGYPVHLPDADAGDVWAINGNFGNVYLFTSDGLFVATLFADCRGAAWKMPVATPGMLVNDASLGAEDFWPTITQTADGHVYMQVHNSLVVDVEGLDSVHRLPESTLNVTTDQLREAQAYFLKSEAARQQASTAGDDTLNVAMPTTAPIVDGDLKDWAGADWATIDIRINQVGDWGHAEAKTQAAVAVSGDKLYAAFHTGDPTLLTNSGELITNLFKTGGALDLMIGSPATGERLLVTRVNGKTTAVLYRPKAPAGAPVRPVQFSSPVSSITFDQVEDVSSQVTLASDKTGDYEMSVPLSVLGIAPKAGDTISGDIGVLRGDGFQTLQRVYWHNKATGIVSDVPSEAELTPELWGKWVFGGARGQ